MKLSHRTEARKRPVNLTLNEDLVMQARGLTDNLSGVVESLLADYVTRERAKHQARLDMVAATVANWNDFSERQGSFADEYSTL